MAPAKKPADPYAEFQQPVQQSGADPYSAFQAPVAASPQPPAPKPEGFLQSLGAQFGITPEAEQQRQDEFKAHPVRETLKELGGPAVPAITGAYQGAKRIGGELYQAGKSAVAGDGAGTAYHAVKALPIVGPAMDKAADQYADKDYAGEMGTLTGAAVQAAPVVAGAVEKPMGYVANAGKMGASRFSQTAYPKNMALSSEEQAAQGFVKALVPPVKAVNRITSAAPEIPAAQDFAQRNNMPINGKLDLAKAADGAAQELQTHYDRNLLAPHADAVTRNIPRNYNGERVGTGETRGGATLGQINNRVNAINSELKSNFRKALDSETGQANASDADLNAEKRALTQVLHQELGQRNGITPEEVASVRQRAGKLRTLAEETRLSANTDTVGEGRGDAGSGGVSSIRHAVVDKLGGGREVIGNRILKKSLEPYKAKSTPLPGYKAK